MSKIKFLANFIRRPDTIGAICPSSEYLAQELVQNVGLEHASAAVEIGPGTGAVTPFILNAIRPGAKFFAVELNKDMYNCFRSRHPHVRIYNEDAARLQELARMEQLPHVDTVVSGLPWSIFNPELQDKILDAVVGVLPDGGAFTTFAYLSGVLTPGGKRFKAALRNRFRKVERSRVEWRNLPPAFCYRCRK